jgi:hypothetical protein
MSVTEGVASYLNERHANCVTRPLQPSGSGPTLVEIHSHCTCVESKSAVLLQFTGKVGQVRRGV